ncbi:wd g-beta repeat-containing protein [Cyclospora cayetanensis]|uniref:Wd g-beta repeat-containing protein n=1 Tax=Cyclospora cayetanensis TaxID=88456 RepID=A0A1D3D8Q2_9EIME|nr:wd g-beta repeat-containing protein [Cyclospora cayetanensis]
MSFGGFTEGKRPSQGTQRSSVAAVHQNATERFALPPVSLSCHHVFGSKPNVRGGVHFTEASAVCYPCGRLMVLHKLEKKAQKFLHGADEGLETVCTAVSQNKRYLLVGERSERRALVSVYDLITLKTKKTLAFADCQSTEFRSVAFSGDSRHILALGGPPDWCLVYWAWEKAKVVASYKSGCSLSLLPAVLLLCIAHSQLGMPSLEFCECSFNPLDSSIVCLVGDGVSRMLRLQDGQLRVMQNYLYKRQGQQFTSHAWLCDDSLIVASHSGDLTLLDGTGDFVATLSCSPGLPGTLRCLVPTSKGFVCGGAGASIRIFEKSQDPTEIYELTTDVSVDNQAAEGTHVSSLAMSPKEDTVAIGLSNGQLFLLSLKAKAQHGPHQAPATPVLSFLHTSFHTGAIYGMDVCTQKPLAVTCGDDQTIRVWDFLERRLELCQNFPEEIFSVAFHPSSYHILAGFADKLRLMNLMLGELRTVKEFAIKASRECRFSHGGHMFAAASGNMIEVFNMYSWTHQATLRGHSARVASFSWSVDDRSIASAGHDGAVYEFLIDKEGTRTQDCVQKNVQLYSIVQNPLENGGETSELFAVGSDACIKQIQQSQLLECYDAVEPQGAIAVLSNGRAFFTGVSVSGLPGSIRCYKAPISGEYGRHMCHEGPVTRLAVAANNSILLSAGADGVLCVWNVNDREAAPVEQSTVKYMAEVLVDRTHLMERQSHLTELERQVEDVSNQMDFQQRRFETQHKDAMSQLETRFNKELAAERQKFDILREEKLEAERLFHEQLEAQEEQHSAAIQVSRTPIGTSSKVIRLKSFLLSALYLLIHFWRKATARQIRVGFALELLQRLLSLWARTEWSRQMTLQAKQAEDELQRMRESKELALKTHQELLQQVEEDADRQALCYVVVRLAAYPTPQELVCLLTVIHTLKLESLPLVMEIESLKEMYERRLAEENAEKVKLRGQAGIFRQRYEDAKEQAEQLREAARMKEERAARLKADVDKLVADRTALNQELQERDKTIGEKEQRIYDLKRQNQELEKFKFVLDYKINQLKAVIDPKTRDIQEMQAQIQAMDSELVEYHRQGKVSAMEMEQLKLKHKALRDEISAQRQKIAQGEQRMRRLQLDIYECMQYLQDPHTLKQRVTALYRKYLTTTLPPSEVDTDILKEQTRQRDYLEKSVECLKKRLGKDSEMHRQDNVKLMQENAALICEINDLRKELLALQSDNRQRKFAGAPKTERDNVRSARRKTPKCEGNSTLYDKNSGDPRPKSVKLSATRSAVPSSPCIQGNPPVNQSQLEEIEPGGTQASDKVAEECAKLIETQASEIGALKKKLELVEKQLETKDVLASRESNSHEIIDTTSA